MPDIKIGDTVKHPSRGTGVVSTVVISPLTKKVTRAWVDFPFIGSATRRFVCFADDLTVVPAMPRSGERPTLKVIEPPQVVA
jgi:hypothetical protein